MSGLYEKIKRFSTDDRVKTLLVGVNYANSGSGSGSEHSAPCLSELVHGFLEDDRGSDEQTTGYNNSDSDRFDSYLDITDSIHVIIKSAADPNNTDPYRNLLMSHVSKAIQMFSLFRTDETVFRRKIMAYLRQIGHNAAICKTKWTSSGSLTAGNYEFIDVVQSTLQNRYFIDLDFASEFKIARPTSDYLALLQHLPGVFIGRAEELKQIVKIVSAWARASLKTKDLSIPPWRKNRYMQNKWLGPYRRTTNQIPANLTATKIHSVNVVKCRCVGFDDSVNGRLFVRTS